MKGCSFNEVLSYICSLTSVIFFRVLFIECNVTKDMYFYLLAIKTYYYLLFIIWNRWRSYSEGKIHMSEPESGNGNVSTVYFVNQAQSLFTMNGHAITNVYLDLSFLFRIMFVKNILLQISFCA